MNLAPAGLDDGGDELERGVPLLARDLAEEDVAQAALQPRQPRVVLTEARLREAPERRHRRFEIRLGCARIPKLTATSTSIGTESFDVFKFWEQHEQCQNFTVLANFYVEYFAFISSL